MKKLPKKYTVPLMMMFMLPTMLLGVPAVLLFRTLPDGVPFFETWLHTLAKTLPFSLMMVIIVGTIARFIVTKFLIESNEQQD